MWLFRETSVCVTFLKDRLCVYEREREKGRNSIALWTFKKGFIYLRFYLLRESMSGEGQGGWRKNLKRTLH